MFSGERQEIILNLLKEKQKITIVELSKHLKVTLNTVRSDVAVLEKDGVIVRMHGGISLPSSNINATNNSIGVRYLKNLNEKRLMAREVIEAFPCDKEFSVFMDSSTSVLEVAHILATSNYRCTVVTHFTNIANILGVNPKISVILCGGTWWSNENCVIGNETIRFLDLYHTDIALIGCTAIKIDRGIFNGNTETVPVKQKMIENADETWLLCDSSKFGEESLMKIADFSQIAKIFSDRSPSSEWNTFLNSIKVQIIHP
ncbi:MAG: DeoR/GlpR family DNA-binding transcription regulator [Brevinema sp.]